MVRKKPEHFYSFPFLHHKLPMVLGIRFLKKRFYRTVLKLSEKPARSKQATIDGHMNVSRYGGSRERNQPRAPYRYSKIVFLFRSRNSNSRGRLTAPYQATCGFEAH